MNSFVNFDKKKKDILNIGKSPRDGLDNITLTEEKEFFAKFIEQDRE